MRRQRTFTLAKQEAKTWCKEHQAPAQRDAQTGAPDGLHAIVIKFHRQKLRFGLRTDADRGQQMIFQPPPHAKKGKVMPLFHP